MCDIDEKQPLQAQVDQLRERLDFIAPRLSLLTGALDYFQKVESEASVQLSRLKFVDDASPACSGAGLIGDSQTLSMAIWFQAMTDCILGQVQTKANMQALLQEQAQTLSQVQQAQTQVQTHTKTLEETQAQALTQTQEQAQAVKALEVQMKAFQSQMEAKVGNLSNAQANHRSSGSSSPHFGRDGTERREWRTSSPSNQSLQVESVFCDKGSRKSSLHIPFPVEQHQTSQTPERPQTLVPSRMDASPRHIVNSMSPGMETTLERHGLALGQGTWANAYRQASGPRRTALRMLCVSGIITERELADDLTIISEEHIEECIAIAGEMLKRWPPEHGPPPLQESKRFFEDQLAALYRRKGPGIYIPEEHR
eukprot:gnl/MRDRNA2_/MRDRNA2_100182_c0_seq1.p1 gnl/MRDRNA2_/MRDRNA2_100182_c0~~gnl/MRDRNA2_/MRDRNA2_100182_c0_seq1.p1  ORF type:complete len:368 (-),score=74.95 gnl/MRDRNA2_/MRDRNA2_100182_c0_seq1:187-1290(-)